jgi:hypothetical protein
MSATPRAGTATATAGSASCGTGGGRSAATVSRVHNAGEKLFLDYADQTVPIYGRLLSMAFIRFLLYMDETSRQTACASPTSQSAAASGRSAGWLPLD